MRVAAGVLLVCALLGSAHGLSEEYVRANSRLLWRSFKSDYAKRYASLVEEEYRYEIFTANMLKAARMERAQKRGATFGVNAFSDLTAEEFQPYHNLRVSPPKPSVVRRTAGKRVEANATRDWRVSDVVTHVKNQGQCGSCWAFAAVANIEGQWKLAGNDLTSLSEQHLVSCDTYDAACNGGFMHNAYEWLLDNTDGKLATESSYPYASGTGTVPACASAWKVGATITKWDLLSSDESEMKEWVDQNGPVAVAVDATAWQTYSSGILTDCCEGTCELNHGVLIVGYGKDYWIVKNSWGSSWGEAGYIQVNYGTGECGLNEYPESALI